jgi:hypothetical protein
MLHYVSLVEQASCLFWAGRMPTPQYFCLLHYFKVVSPVGCVRRRQNLVKHEKCISVVTHRNIPVPSPQSPVPSPQSPVPSPQSPVLSPQLYFFKIYCVYKIQDIFFDFFGFCFYRTGFFIVKKAVLTANYIQVVRVDKG